MELNLNGKRALVTGSSKGLGFAVAGLLAQEGAHVALNGRDPDRLAAAVAELNGSAGATVGFPGDLTHRETPGHLVAAAADAFGGLDILVANAGGPPVGPFEKFDDDAWDAAVELSFLVHVRLIRAALPHLRRSDTPAILSVTSFTVRQPLDNLVLSNTVRAATAALTKSLARELGQDGIRINSILPGWTQTDRVTQLMRGRAQAGGTTEEEEKALITGQIPLGRMGTPDEFARAACFLVSPAASYITGVMLLVDGGVVNSFP
ncbi:MAG TPA: SDR family oxidoreductase [Anaerolineales bacterium]|nr:SDR family oxidoreductase [Anaerolineales bacterium]